MLLIDITESLTELISEQKPESRRLEERISSFRDVLTD
uniref:Uncharacterized protein n=1 Tax=Anguilla anguilla TaxID=7936 RepID=A0A0E9VXP3_ANGAN